jgi:HK97 family phage major capsid protein
MPQTLTDAGHANGSGIAGGVTFKHLSSGDSQVDQLWESGGGFSSFGSYIRTAARYQAGVERTGSAAERYERWASASTVYRSWLARQDHPSVARAIATPDGMFELAEPDGGAVIPPQFVREVWDKARFRDTPLARCRAITVTSNVGNFPGIAEISRVDGSRWGGMLSYWDAEAQQLTATHPKLADTQFRLKKLTGLIPVTDEVFEDADLLDPFLSETVSKEFAFQTNEAMINGNGTGRPLGVVNSPATITVAKDVGQATKTITASNIQNLWIQLHGPSRANSCFYANEEFDPDSLALATTPLTGWTAEVPAPTLKGRYCHPLENCQPIGSPGDIVLGDWSQYVLFLGGMRKTISMHFKFDYLESYFRFIWRCDGQTLWLAPLTSIHGVLQKSPFLVLAQR